MKYKNITFLCLLLWFCTPLFSQTIYQDSKSYRQSFKVSPKGNVQISTKYGNVHFVIWDKDSVRFEVDMLVKANKPDRVKKIADCISFDFSGTPGFLIGQTIFNTNTLWTDVATMANTLFATGTSVNISYYVYLPADCNIKVTNKFGNIYMNQHSGNVDVTVSNGDLNIEEVKGDFRLNQQFGNSFIGQIQNGRINLEFAEIEIEKAKSINFKTSSSRIEIKDADIIELDSRRDKFYISKINTITGQTSFSNINIKNINEQMILNTKYGDFSIDNINKNFNMINITSTYSQINLFINKTTSFQYDFLVKKTEVRIPLNYKQEKQITGGNNGEVRISGFSGNGNSSSKIRLNTVYGRVNIFER